jgi:hypothetical protein
MVTASSEIPCEETARNLFRTRYSMSSERISSGMALEAGTAGKTMFSERVYRRCFRLADLQDEAKILLRRDSCHRTRTRSSPESLPRAPTADSTTSELCSTWFRSPQSQKCGDTAGVQSDGRERVLMVRARIPGLRHLACHYRRLTRNTD